MKLSTAQEAALELNKNILVQANAGSGKTTVMAERFIRLLQEYPDLDPSSILTITFTNLAANELKERIINRLQSQEGADFLLEKTLSQFNTLAITTIHGFCNMVLRQFPLHAELDPDFRIVDPQEAQLLFMEAVETALEDLIKNNPIPLKRVLVSISKSRLLTHLYNLYLKKDISLEWARKFTETPFKQFIPEDVSLEDPSLNYTEDLCTIFNCANTHYNRLKQSRGFLDYHDLLSQTQSLITHPVPLAALQKTYSFIMVDEFQDTDPIQWNIIQKLCDAYRPLDAKKLFIVGDVKQSIYSFRGADFDLFDDVLKQFEAASDESKHVILADNYRTQKCLIDFLNPLFERLFDATSYSPLIANRTDEISDPVSFVLADEDSSVAGIADGLACLVEEILREQPHYTINDIAILSRRKSPLKAVKKVLDERGLQATLLSDTGFFQKDAVLDILALLKGLINPSDQLSWTRVLLSPIFGLTTDHLFSLYVSGALWPGAIDGYEPAILNKMGLDSLPTWVNRAKNESPLFVIRDILLHTQSWKAYQGLSEQAPRDIDTTLDWLEKCFDQARGARYQFLQLLASYIDHNQAPSGAIAGPEQGAKLLTIHAAKGLEFPIVIFTDIHSKFNFSSSDPLLISKHGLQFNITDHKDSSPYRSHILSKIKDDSLKEERRLFYVACTRAKDKLYFFGKHKAEKPGYNSYLDFLRGCSDLKPTTVRPYFKAETLFAEPSSPSKMVIETPIPVSKAPASGPENRVLSVSQVERFLTCSKQFYLSPLLKHMAQTEDITQHSSDYGSLLHASFSSLLDDSCAKPTVPEPFQERLSEETQRFKSDDLWAHSESALTTLVEQSFSLSFGSLILQGRFDLAFLNEEEWTLVDFKTSGSDQHYQDYKYQLELYGLALSKIVTAPVQFPIKLKLYYTKLGTTFTFDLTAERTKDIEERLSKIPGQIMSRFFVPPKPSVCETCPVFSLNSQCASEEF
ncbi:hypothetical protein DID80_03795 [Candidatus Marinamargulisbacteria bacterium SCGC AAA071-K20]|nr:hypothetical protein DID80_03795 [Candidatus Marinamargulisbacteria bacterium SCGC AAA071-K20]